MPNIYYPRISDLITLDQIPESLGFVQNISQLLFNKIYYKDYQVSSSPLGDNAFYSLSIVSRERIGFNFSEDQLMEILRKNDITEEAINIKKYAGRTSLIQTIVDPNGIKKFKPVQLLIDDISGKILIDISTYSKDLYGEEQFNRDFNKILIERTKKR